MYISISVCLFVLVEGVEEGPDVVNGLDAKITERTFQVSLQINNNHFCGGCIISPLWVLTAAHCDRGFIFYGIEAWSAAAGMIDVHKPGQWHYLKKFISPKQYKSTFIYLYDIALAELKTPFIFNEHVQPIILPNRRLSMAANSAVFLSGWGSLGGSENKKPTILQIVELQIVDPSRCKQLIERHRPHRYFPSNICAYNLKVQKGQCSGNSGGPLTYGRVLVGIASWSFKDPYCGSTKTPGIYTRVSSYISWIEKCTNLNFSDTNVK